MKIQTHRNEVCVKTEAEIGVMLLHVREQQEPQEAGGGLGKVLPEQQEAQG